jgi:hypothetical protein
VFVQDAGGKKTAVIGPRLEAEMASWSAMGVMVIVGKSVDIGDDMAW